MALAVSASAAVGCAYVLDSEELDAKGSGISPEPSEPGDAGPTTASGEFTTALDTPPIELDFEGEETTRDPCVATTLQAREILSLNCSDCHAPPGAAGGFSSVLDFPTLVNTVSSLKDPVTNEPVRLLVPGFPNKSRLFLRMRNGEMPPRRPPSEPQLRRPSISDVSVIQAWIRSCIATYPAAISSEPAAGAGGTGSVGAGGSAMVNAGGGSMGGAGSSVP